MNYSLACIALLALAPALFAAPKAPPPVPPIPAILAQSSATKVASSGTYRDASGGEHPWSITQAHALKWGGAPYIPVGGTFTPTSWAADSTDDAWAADKQALDSWKAHGVLDICLTAGNVGLTQIPADRVQRVIDYLDANGFRYGIKIADYPKDPLVGYVIKPGVYRDPSPPADGPVRFGPISGLVDAFYLLASRTDASIDSTGAAKVDDQGTATVDVHGSSSDDVLLLYPQRMFLPGSPESHLPDLWQGYDEYRDRLLSFFRKIKLGPGFRFFLDPLAGDIGLDGEVNNLIPTTDGFRLDFQAWLDKKYDHNMDDLNRGWGIADPSTGTAIPDFATAARSIPLWFEARGVPAIYDPISKVSYAVTNKPHIAGHYWDDLNDFRIQSTRGYMNAIADALRQGVADVPVVYQWTSHSALFSNDRSTGGYNGLSMGSGDADIVTGGAYTYAQAEESPRTTWLIADLPKSTSLARPALFNNWDSLRDIGARGFFLATPPKDSLDWLNAYAASVQVSAPALLQSRTTFLPYPVGIGLTITAHRLASGAWWLPSYSPGAKLMIGPTLSGYYMTNTDSRMPTFVVWSPDDNAGVPQFDLGKDNQPVITDSAGNPLKVDHKGSVWSIPIGRDPVLISHVHAIPLPQSAADDAEKEANRLLALADDQNINTVRYKQQLFYALNSIPTRTDNVNLRYSLISRVIDQLTNVLRPYTWIEAERSSKYTFDSLVPDPAASGGAYLSLNTPLSPPAAVAGEQGGYHADYKFTVNAPGRYEIWMAGSPLGTKDVSTFQYIVDNGASNDSSGSSPSGDMYAGKFVWSHIGDATLTRGSHTLTIVVNNRRASDNHYALAIDALCLSRVPFHPDGINQPAIDVLPPPTASPASADKTKKGKR